jgi:hypothetical protein
MARDTPPASAPAPGAASDGDETARLAGEVERLTTALHDIVALALTSGDHKERAIMMHRRAVAALSRTDVRPPARSE